MSKLSDQIRAFADECEAIESLTGVIFAASGDLEIHLACADPLTSPLDTIRNLVMAAHNAATHGTMKPQDHADVSAKIEAILNG